MSSRLLSKEQVLVPWEVDIGQGQIDDPWSPNITYYNLCIS
jgi:hypothetical protein